MVRLVRCTVLLAVDGVTALNRGSDPNRRGRQGDTMDSSAFFAYARERHSIHLRRSAGLPRDEWTQDAILREYRFCNIFRELDTTTEWFAHHVRTPLRDSPDVLLATALFRWFNRISTGEAVFLNRMRWDDHDGTAWEHLVRTGRIDPVRRAILAHCGTGPYVTGSYIIKTMDGVDKLSGVLLAITRFMRQSRADAPGSVLDQGEMSRMLLRERGQHALEFVWRWLTLFPYLGHFMAYEIVTDLRHTALLDQAPDILTWANPGPGAERGLNRIMGRDVRKRMSRRVLLEEMQTLLAQCTDPANWPSDWPAWEMREVEHTLCEFDKYERVRLGQGAPRQKFRSTR